MIVNKQWFRIYQEEAGDDGAAGGGGESAGVTTEATTEAETTAEAPDWLQGKYHTEGKSIEDATTEQAKAYNELSSKFGSFTGAPEEYTEAVLSDELKELGIEIKSDDPMLKAAQEFAKESNMNQEGLNGLVNLYAMQQVAENKANEEYVADQLKQLGNSDARIKNIQDWANKNLDAESVAGLESMATSAEAIKALEQIIAKSRGAAVDVDDAASAAGVGALDVQKMQFEKDENGNRKINTDPEFRKRYHKLRNEVFGTAEHREMVG